MKTRFLNIFIILIFAFSFSLYVSCDCGDDDDDDDSGNQPPPEDVEEFIERLVTELDTSGVHGTWVAHVAPTVVSGDVVIEPAEGESEFTPNGDYWFAFVDENPFAWFEHEVKFVFLDADSGQLVIEDQGWWPEVDGKSILDSDWGLIKVFAAATPEWRMEQATKKIMPMAEAPEADYGDAPDDSIEDYSNVTYYGGGVAGHYPTLFATDNSMDKRPGGHTLTVGEEMIGANVSAETDANDPNDPDNVANLVDNDRDDGVFWIFFPNYATKTLDISFLVNVTVSASAPDVDRYINILADHNRDGEWKQNTYGKEWLVENFTVKVPPGESKWVWTTPVAMPLDTDNTFAFEAWVRVALTRSQIDGTIFANNGWDGSGQFDYGEIEDYYYNFIPWSDDDDDDDDDDDNDDDDDDNPKPKKPGGETPEPESKDCKYTCLLDMIDIDISCKALIINFGDRSADESHVAQDAAKAVKFFQGYLGSGNVSYMNNPTAADALKSIEDFLEDGKCLDELYIYLVGHGGKSGYIRAQNGKGKLKPEELHDAITANTHCPDTMDYYDDGCREPGYCNINVIVTSCYGGNFTKGDDSIAIDGVNVLTAASSSQTAAGMPNGDGAYVSSAYFGAFEGNQADNPPNGDGNGEVSAEEAMKWAKGNYGGPDTGADYSAGSDCECDCTSLGWLWDDPEDDLIFWEDKTAPTYVGHLDILQYGISVTGSGFDALITTATALPGSSDTGFHEYYAVFDTDLPNYGPGGVTHDGDTAYIAQFLNGVWTMFLFIYDTGSGWTMTATSSTVEVSGNDLVMHISTAESGMDFSTEFVPTRMATWYAEGGVTSVGDDTTKQDGTKGKRCF